MNHNKKSRIIMIFSAILLGFVIFGALYLGAGVGLGEIETYDLVEISKYKTPYVGDGSKVSAIARHLPVPDSYFKQQYISMITDNKPYELNVFYEAKKGALHSGEWPIVNPNNAAYANLQKNALVLYCMIDNLDTVTFKFRDSQSDGKLDASKYDTTFTFSRASIEEKYGDLSRLSDNLDLLEDALMGKISAFKGLELYVWKKPGLTGNNDLFYTLLIGTNRNKTKSEVYDLNTAVSDLDLIKQELLRYSSGTYLSIFHSMDIDKETMAKIGDALSGTIKNGVISIGGREFDKDLINDLQAPDLRSPH